MRSTFLLTLLLASSGLLAQNVGIKTTTPQGALDLNGELILRPADLIVDDDITYALDVNTIRFSNYRLEGPTGDFTIAGITEAIDGRLITLFNRSGFTMQLNNEDPAAADNDRIITGTDEDIIIPDRGIVSLQYDATEQRWIVKSSSRGSTGSGGGGYWEQYGNDIYNLNSGNVGIGTYTPVSILTMQTDINTTGWTHIGGTDEIIVNEAIGGISASIGTMTDHAFRLKANGESKLNIYPGGEVVVGDNNTPSFGKFTVQTPNNNYGISHISEEGNILATRIGGTTAGIGTFSATDMRIYSGGLSRVIISQATGEVFIGTDNPTTGSKLTVQTLNNSNGIVHMGENGNILSTRMGGTSAGIGTFSNTNMRLFCNSVSALIIDAANGNIGIGTDAPTYKLTVNGTIRTKELRVNTGWADYVFENDYNLLPLPEVERFIRANKHLPGIPPASLLVKEGVDVSDMQTKMMAKIEELTLYLIEANKTIETLKQRLTSIEKKNK